MDEYLYVELNLQEQYGFGNYYSGFPLFHHLYLSNPTNQHFQNLNISIQTTPDVLLKGESVVDFLLPGGHQFISCDFVEIDAKHLMEIDSVQDLLVSVVISLDNGKILQRSEFSAKLLPYHFFTGLFNTPEALAFFVTPDQNDLNSVYVNHSFSDSVDFCNQLFENIKLQRITFSSADFADHRSKPVRLPERVLSERFGNALEICLLFCSCCEKADLNTFIAYSAKGRVFAGISTGQSEMKLLTSFERGQKNLDDLYLVDASYLSYGSELDFDHAVYQTKNALNLNDEKLYILNIKKARNLGLRALPSRILNNGKWDLIPTDDQRSISELNKLIQSYSENDSISSFLAALATDRISVNGTKTTLPFQWDLDVNQNKILAKVLSNNLTLIRAQMGSGATTLFSHAASRALLSGKSVLYVKDPHYHSDDFSKISANYFHPSFVFEPRESCDPLKKAEFSGRFQEHLSVFEDKQKLDDLLYQLDSYYTALDGERTIVSSFVVASDRYHQLQDANCSVVFSPEQVGSLTDDMVQEWFTTAGELINAFSEIGKLSEHPLLLIRQQRFSYEYKSHLISKLEDVLHSLESVIQLRDQLSIYFPSLNGIRTIGVFLAFQELIRLFGEFSTIPTPFFDQPDRIEDNFRKITQLIRSKKENDSIRESVLIIFSQEIFDTDISDLYFRYEAAINDKSFKGIAQKHSVIKTVKRYLLPNCDVENIENIIHRLYDYQRNKAFIESEKEFIFKLLSIDFHDRESDWDALQHSADLCYQCYSVFLTSLSPEQLPSFVNDYRLFLQRPKMPEMLSDFRKQSELFGREKELLEKLVMNPVDSFIFRQGVPDADYFAELNQYLTSVLASVDQLKDWCLWLEAKSKAVSIGLKNLVSAIENGKLEPGECKRSFLRAFFKAVCEYNFISHADLIPDHFDFHSIASECVALQKSIQSKRSFELDSHLSLRRLEALSDLPEEFVPEDILASKPQTFLNLYPCVCCDLADAIRLFSGREKLFDYVLIENRSALSFSDFLELYQLGKRVSFAGAFGHSIKNFYGIFSPLQPAFDLLWKKMDEKYSLTAVYDCDPSMASRKRDFGRALGTDCHLYSMPSSKYVSSAKWILVNGIFDNEYPLSNLEEAEFCVEELVRLVKTDKTSSVGVIAFSEQQKRLILRLFSQRLRSEEQTERFESFDRIVISSVSDPIVKCDHIILSTTFAPNRSNPGSGLPFACYEFGNTDPYKLVFSLISSAMKSLTVISSFDDSVFKFSPSVLPAIGSLRLLYQCVLSAESRNDYSVVGILDNANVVKSLAEDLSKQGHRVLCGIQSGRYYIDLAVMDSQGNFVLGIISDQTVMNQKANVSAIELANAERYQCLGWRLYRLSASRCFDSYDRELENILNILSPTVETDYI